MAKTLTLRLDDADSQTMKNLAFCSEKLGEKTASKTLVAAMNVLPTYMKMAAEQREEIDKLRSEIYRLNSIIESSREASLRLYEATAQADLLEE